MLRRRDVRGLLCAFALAASASALGAQAAADAPAAAPTVATPATTAAPFPRGRTVTDSLWSAALGTRKRFVVHLPPGYDTAPGRRWPVLYYLHGLWGDETNWVRRGALDRTADSLTAAGHGAAIVVMPDGDDAWYTTWHALGDAARCRADTVRREPAATYCVPWPHYDDYLARDLVARVDSAYRTRPRREARAVAGLSMGGYGAVSLALRYPDVYTAAASHSGVLAPLLAGPRPFPADGARARWAPSVDSLRTLYRGYWTTLPLAFGADTAAWWSRDPARLAGRLVARGVPVPALHVDVGTDDGLLAQNRAFRAELRALGVPLAYAEWPGGHTWDYWRAHAPESLAWLLARVTANGARAARAASAAGAAGTAGAP